MQPLFLTSGGISECASSTGPLEISPAWQDPEICQFAPHPPTPDCLTNKAVPEGAAVCLLTRCAQRDAISVLDRCGVLRKRRENKTLVT